jgi:hypothetical protein
MGSVTIHNVRTLVLDYGELLAYWFVLHAINFGLLVYLTYN